MEEKLTVAQRGAMGGKATTQAKQDAARVNGHKGGRPRGTHKAEIVCTCGRGVAPHKWSCRIEQTMAKRASREQSEN